jgi:hypothetical protein
MTKLSNLDDGAFLKRVFECRQEPAAWFSLADTLRAAADVLFTRLEDRYEDGEPRYAEDVALNVDKPAMLLLSFAVENTIKGNLLATGKVSLSKGKLPEFWKHHDLAEMYKATGLDLQGEQEWLLKQLWAFAMWAGRYPVSWRLETFTLEADYVSPLSREDNPPAILPPIAFSTSERKAVDKLLAGLRIAADL